jgi:hypothetical protein
MNGSFQPVTVIGGYFDLRYVADPALVTVQVALVDSVESGEPTAALPTIPTTAAEAVAAIERNPSVDVIESSASRMGGLDGDQITIERPFSDSSPMPAWHVLTTPGGDLALPPGARYWMAFFDAPQGLVAVLVLGPADRWEPALLAAEPVLETITFVAP